MKTTLLTLLALAALFSGRARAETQTFTGTEITGWVLGFGDWQNDHRSCTWEEQEQTKHLAEQTAQANCARAGIMKCLVDPSASQITYNTAPGNPFSDDMLGKYGLQKRNDGFAYYGCEASAIAYGLSN
jgi:hypothetical protein